MSAARDRARRYGGIVALRLSDLEGVPNDLRQITLVYSRGDAHDVLVLTEDGEQTLRLDYATPMEREAIRVALIYAEAPRPAAAVLPEEPGEAVKDDPR